MATPRLGLVVEDKPTELSCTYPYIIPAPSNSIILQATRLITHESTIVYYYIIM